MTILLFDMDGVLTAPRQRMTADFSEMFLKVVAEYPAYIVTGSNHQKVREQIPLCILARLACVFACSGNELWERGSLIDKRDHDFSFELLDAVEEWAAASRYPVKIGPHLEMRTGMLNVSVVGRNADADWRQDYAKYDRDRGERKALVDLIAERFPEYEATCGGEISVDITPKGWNKSQVVTMLPAGEDVHFFADRLGPRGNDRPLAEALTIASASNRILRVCAPEETHSLLESRYLRVAA